MNEELKIFITAELDELKKELNNGKKEVEDFSKKGESGFKKFGDAAKKVGSVVATGLKAATAAIAAGAGALIGLSASTEEYRVAQSKLITAFEAEGAAADTAKGAYNDLYRVLGDSDVAVEAANHLAKLTTNEKELSEWTNICQGVYATFGDSLPIEGLTEAANETARVGAVTGPLADALNWAGVSEDEFNAKLEQCATTQEREALIRETLNGLYSDAAAGYEKNAADILAANEAQSKLNDAMARLGEIATPIITLMKSFGADLLTTLAPGLEQVADGLTGLANGTEGAADTLKEGISGLITGIINKITELLPTLLPLGINIITSLITGIVQAMPQVIEALINGITLIIEALPGLIQTLAEALPTLLPQLINGLVSLIILLCENFASIIQPIIDNLPDIIMSVVTALLDNLPALIQGVIDLIVGIVNATGQIIEVLVPMIPDIIMAIVEALWESLPTLLGGVWDILGSVLDLIWSLVVSIWDYLGECWDNIKSVFGKVGTWIYDKVIAPVGDFFKGMWDGLKNGAKKAWEGITSVFSKVTTWFKEKFSAAWNAVKNIFSTGGKIFDGIKDGISNVFKTVVNGIISGINKIIKVPFDAINGMLNKIRSISILGVEPFISLWKHNPLSVPQIPKLAKGGIVDSATLAVVGEQGKEAIMPLENNTEWIDTLADKLAARNNPTTPIVLNVDGKTFAQTSINTINELTRQTGSLKLNVI